MLPEISTPFAFLDWQSKEEKESLLQGFDKGRNWDKLRPDGPLGSYADFACLLGKGLGTGPINRLRG